MDRMQAQDERSIEKDKDQAERMSRIETSMEEVITFVKQKAKENNKKRAASDLLHRKKNMLAKSNSMDYHTDGGESQNTNVTQQEQAKEVSEATASLDNNE